MMTERLYPPRIPQELPADRVLVHSHVRPARKQGTRGFRFWLQVPTDQLARCESGWAKELGEHYRVEQSDRTLVEEL